MRQSLRVSLWVYAGLMAYLVFVKVVLTVFPAVFRSPAQAKVFAWPAIAIFAAIGSLGVFLADRTGFPAAWGGEVSARRRLFAPTVWGIALGVLAILTDLATGWTQIAGQKMHLPSIHIAWPASLPIYPGGAIIVEVIYRLFLIPALLWLVSSLILRGQAQDRVFWVLAVVTSLLEPLSQDLGGILHGPGQVGSAVVFVEDFALNFVQASTFRRLGFLSAIWVRVIFYLFWHVAWPALGGG